MKPIVSIIVAFALFMEMMDSTVIATSLAAIATDIHVNPITLKLALTTYLVALGMFIPVSGWFSDRFGVKNVFRLAIFVFIMGSIACSLSSNLTEFILSRFLQGMGGSMMMPVGRLIIVRLTPKSQLVSAMTLVSIPALVGPLMGPPLGGFITTYFSWRWIFLINVPIGLIGICLCSLYLPKVPAQESEALDWRGFILCALGASGIVFGLSVISMPALPPLVGIMASAIGLACVVAYIAYANRIKKPILDLRLFQDHTFRNVISGATLFRIGNGAQPFLLPLMLQLCFGMNPFQAGMIMFSGVSGALVSKFFAKSVVKKYGFRRILLSASLVGSSGIFASCFYNAQTPVWVMIIPLFLGAIFRSLLFTFSNSLALSCIPEEKTGASSAILSVFQQISIALGVALAGIVLESAQWWNGKILTLFSFHLAFGVTAFVSVCSIFCFLNLSDETGVELSGHQKA